MSNARGQRDRDINDRNWNELLRGIRVTETACDVMMMIDTNSSY